MVRVVNALLNFGSLGDQSARHHWLSFGANGYILVATHQDGSANFDPATVVRRDVTLGDSLLRIPLTQNFFFFDGPLLLTQQKLPSDWKCLR